MCDVSVSIQHLSLIGPQNFEILSHTHTLCTTEKRTPRLQFSGICFWIFELDTFKESSNTHTTNKSNKSDFLSITTMTKRPRIWLPSCTTIPMARIVTSSIDILRCHRSRTRRNLHNSATTSKTATAADSRRTCLRHGESSSSLPTKHGVVEGVWIFTRHGDRSPGRCLVPAHRRKQEGAFWVSKLPFPDSTAAYNAYSQYFPLQVAERTNQGHFLDTRRNPFGFLSQKGLAQLKESGHGYLDRYNHLGRHLPGQTTWENAHDFLSAWHVSVYSTNYLRTVLSAQSFLDGLLGTHCFSPSQDRPLDWEYYEERNLPDHHSYKATASSSSAAARHASSNNSTTTTTTTPALVPVTVRALHKDPLNAFDRNPDLIAELVAQVMTSPEFQRRDAAAAPLAARLANVLPGTYSCVLDTLGDGHGDWIVLYCIL